MMSVHPCIGCINNWSGDQTPCSDYCEELTAWEKQQRANFNAIQSKVPSIPEASGH